MNIFRLHNNLSKLSDRELLEKYKSEKDREYVGELFKRYSELTFLVCIKYLKDNDAAKDAVMDIFEILLSKLLTQSITNFKSWLYVVAKNHCLVILRKNKETVDFNEIYISQTIFMENENFLNLNNESDISFDIIDKMIKRLKEFQRKCITMFYLKKMSYKEIALAENQTEMKVKSCIQNGKRNLKILLDEYIKLNEK